VFRLGKVVAYVYIEGCIEGWIRQIETIARGFRPEAAVHAPHENHQHTDGKARVGGSSV